MVHEGVLVREQLGRHFLLREQLFHLLRVERLLILVFLRAECALQSKLVEAAHAERAGSVVVIIAVELPLRREVGWLVLSHLLLLLFAVGFFFHITLLGVVPSVTIITSYLLSCSAILSQKLI